MIRLFLVFAKIGFLGFGGGYAMLSLIYQELTSLGISATEFADLNALDLLAPGPIAVNSATYVGYVTYGLLGGIVATLAVCLSSFVLSGILLKYEAAFMANPVIHHFFTYAKLAAIGMICSVGLSLMSNAIFLEKQLVVSLSSLLLVALLRFKYKVGTLKVLFSVGIMGGIFYFLSLIF